jgi:hypothetical protein
MGVAIPFKLPSQCRTCSSLAPFLKLICARLKIREKGEGFLSREFSVVSFYYQVYRYFTQPQAHKVQTEWQRPLSGLHYIMIEKLDQAGLTIFTITYKVAVYAPAERADTLPLFPLYPYVLYAQHSLGITKEMRITR